MKHEESIISFIIQNPSGIIIANLQRVFAMPNDNTGYFYPNEGSTGKQPHYTGRVFLEGAHYNLAGWFKTDKKGKLYLSLKINPVRNSTTDGFPPVGEDGNPEEIF